MDNTVVKKQNSPVKTLLLGIAVMVAALWTGKYTLFTLLALPFIGAYVTAKLTPSWSFVYYAAVAAACFLLLPNIWLIAFLMITLSSLLTGIAVRKKMRSYESVLLSCAGWICAFGVIIAASYLTHGTSPLSLIVDKIRAWAETSDFGASICYLIIQMLQAASAQTVEAMSIMLANAQDVFYSADFATMRELALSENGLSIINNLIALRIPSLAVQFSLLGGLFSYLVTRVFVKRSGQEVADVPRFRDFKLPRQLATTFALVFSLAYLSMYFFDLSANLIMILTVLTDACTVIFTVQAVTLINWFLSLRSKSKGAKIALSIVIPLVASIPGINALPWLGYFEMIFKLRYRTIVRSTGSGTDNKH